MEVNKVSGSNLSFKASLNVMMPVNNPERLINISRVFTELTSGYKSDILNVTKSQHDNQDVYQIAGKSKNPASHILISISSLLEKYDDNEIAKKLAKIFHSLKAENKYSAYENELLNNIESAMLSMNQNKRLVKRYQELNKPDYAKVHESIATRNRAKIKRLREMLLREEVKLANKLKAIAGGDSDLETISKAYTD